MYIRMYIHTYIHTYIYTYIHTYIVKERETERRERYRFASFKCPCVHRWSESEAMLTLVSRPCVVLQDSICFSCRHHVTMDTPAQLLSLFFPVKNMGMCYTDIHAGATSLNLCHHLVSFFPLKCFITQTY